MTFIEAFRNKVDVIEENRSYLKAKCPVCGDSSLKMNLSETHKYYGAYRCWTNDCNSKKIRGALGLSEAQSKQSDPFSASNVFSESNLFLSLKKDPEYYPDNFTGKKFLTLKDYKGTPQVEVFSGKSKFTKTTYFYSPYLRTVRIDVPSQKKKLFIQNWDVDLGWCAGTGEKIWPVYGMKSALLHSSDYINSDSVVFVEGEKCAEYLRNKGCAAFTFASPCYSGDRLYQALVIFKYFFPMINNILYVPDADSAGLSKEKWIREKANKCGLGYTCLKLSDIFPDLNLDNTGLDVVDLPWNPIRNAIRNLENT